MTVDFPRTWTADLVFDGEPIAAPNADFDLKKDQVRAALREAARLLGPADESVRTEIYLYKTTKARGTEPEARYIVRFDERRPGWIADGPFFAGDRREQVAR